MAGIPSGRIAWTPVRMTRVHSKEFIGCQPLRRARIEMVIIRMAASSRPGTTPARKSAPSEVPVTTE